MKEVLEKMNVELGKFIEEKIKKEIENIRIIFKM